MFTKIVQELIKSGLTETDIAEKVNCTQPTINRIRNGKTKPMGELGMSLAALRKKRERFLKS